MIDGEKNFVIDIIEGARQALNYHHDELCDCTPCAYHEDLGIVKKMLLSEWDMFDHPITCFCVKCLGHTGMDINDIDARDRRLNKVNIN